MKRTLLLIIITIFLDICAFAQSQSKIESLCQKSIAAAQNNDFATAKQNYDSAISMIGMKPNSDLVLAVPEELSEYCDSSKNESGRSSKVCFNFA